MPQKANVIIINYGMGNLASVANALYTIGYPVTISHDPQSLEKASHIILPGVGSFGDGMTNLKKGNWLRALEKGVIEEKKPFLGICLGMQLLATQGTENGVHDGLGWVPGIVKRLPKENNIRVPHVGWNDAKLFKDSKIYQNLDSSQVFYFVHSYFFEPEDQSVVSSLTSYGIDFASSIEIGNIFATQFHPEKSQKAGLEVLKNFLNI